MYPIAYSPEVKAALANHQPVVALESTIIAHGMPYPQNLETALRVEQIIKDAGAVPATCAIVGGELSAGLTAQQMEYIAKSGHQMMKVSRRDVPYLVAKQLDGATTVASTMIIAHLAGIKVFATGGIGGVHRGAETNMDISADLQELAHTPVAVVSAGIKSILDIGLTLEYLETYGVPVVGFGTHEFPAFFSRESGFNVDFRLDTASEIAALLHAKWQIDQRGGAVIANPVPVEYSQNAAEIEAVIQQALAQAAAQGVKGKAITPFLLSRIEQITGGKSLLTNIELVCNNARLAADIAIALTSIQYPHA
jgi:pseudouridylate synthase